MLVFAWTLSLAADLEPALGVGQPPLSTSRGVVAADSALASEVGAEILAAGGNAADAAVAVAATLGVVQPFASGLGGGGFCLYFRSEDAQVFAYDFREVAPAAAHGDMFLDAEGNPQPQRSLRGGLAVAVPGEAAGLAALHAAHGRRPFGSNLSAPIALARSGYPAGSLLVERIARYRDELERSPGLAEWLLPGGQVPAVGDTLRNPALADTLGALAEHGPSALYEGPLAAELAAAVAAAGGLLTPEDLRDYRVESRAPLTGSYRGFAVYTMPPPSSGGVALLEALNILAGFDLGAMDHNSSKALHHVVEALKFAFADRAQFLGDPAFVDVPIGRLTSSEHAQALRRRLDPESVLATEAYGVATGLPEDGGTSHFSIVDGEGNAAACTTTINTGFGSLVYATRLGVLLNNEMDDFVQKPGAANAYGLVGTEANAIAPGKRPLSSMSPTILVSGQQVVLVVGGSGGPQIISGVLQAVVSVVDWGLDVRAAVEAPRVHHQWLPDVLSVEPEFAEDVVSGLARRGHRVEEDPAYSAVQAVHVDAGGRRTAASDPRKRGAPAAESRPEQGAARAPL